MVGQGHLKGLLCQGELSVETIGFQWADRVPWLCDDPVDAAIRLERNDYLGRNTLQARLVALTPAVSYQLSAISDQLSATGARGPDSGSLASGRSGHAEAATPAPTDRPLTADSRQPTADSRPLTADS